jgi:hypothetical protein
MMEKVSFEFLSNPFPAPKEDASEEEKKQHRRLRVVTLYKGICLICDGFAQSLLKGHLAQRPDIEFAYAPADRAETGRVELPEDTDLLFLGRPDAFIRSGYREFVIDHESKRHGCFLDSPTGATGDAIRYQTRLYRSLLLDIPRFPQRHAVRDYAVLTRRWTCVDGVNRLVWALSGVTGFSTLMLTLILVNENHRQTLRDQVRALGTWKPTHRPSAGAEILVRFDAPETLEGLPDGLEQGRLPGQFQAEAVAVESSEGGSKLSFRPRMLQLQPDTQKDRGGWVLDLDLERRVYLSPVRYELIKRLWPEREVRKEELLKEFNLTNENNLERRASDLNSALLAGRLDWEVNAIKKAKTYRLETFDEADHRRGPKGRRRR